MIPRRTARYTRQAMALASGKYTEPRIAFVSPGAEGERRKHIEAIATPIVTLMYGLVNL
jgi:hypothetical protein